MTMQIRGSTALVTGANRGLGLAFAKALLEAGAAKVYAGARDPSKVALAGVTPLALDITDRSSVAAAARVAGDVNVLINNAAVLSARPFLADDAEQAVRAALETNLFGTLSMARAFAPVLAANGGGALVNMLSVLSWLNLPTVGAYGASKAAAWALTNGLRNELRAQGTLVVGVHAAFIDTDMASFVQAPKSRPEDVARQVLAAIEEGREEVLADEVTRNVKRGLSAEPASYLMLQTRAA
jgi:NAD(P)-dependent dehydrogenase (short-subunit alcohol dehydrogenase family)